MGPLNLGYILLWEQLANIIGIKMTILHKVISLRPTSDVEFFTPPEDLRTLRTEYTASNKIVKQELLMSADQLTRTVVTTFESKEVFLDYIYSKPVRDTFTIRMSYNERHQIVEVISFSDEEGKPFFLHTQ